MPDRWLRIFDAALDVADLARRFLPRAQPADAQAEPSPSALGPVEQQLAGVVVAALREVFDRDSRRLELERDQIDAERERAERLLELELLRQAGDREIGRLRLIAGVAFATWAGSLLFLARLMGGHLGARATLGVGWVLLLAALASALVAQARVSAELGKLHIATRRPPALSSGLAGALALWLVVVGLAAVGAAILMA
jgi:hypothetical protein